MGYTFGAMPWNQVTPMEEKQRFVSLAGTGKCKRPAGDLLG